MLFPASLANVLSCLQMLASPQSDCRNMPDMHCPNGSHKQFRSKVSGNNITELTNKYRSIIFLLFSSTD